MTQPDQQQLLIVVAGEETLVAVNPNAPLRTAVQHALNQTENHGRPLEDWELRDERGNLLDLARKIGEYAFPPRAMLYLTLTVGVNGALLQARWAA